MFTCNYRVSHGKVNKVILLCWGCKFWILLIFWILHIHEIGPFMPSSLVFIQLMLCALYRMILISKHSKTFFWQKSLNVPTVKLFSNFCWNFLSAFLMLFGFRLLILGKSVSICCLLLFFCLKRPLKLKIYNLIKSQITLFTLPWATLYIT